MQPARIFEIHSLPGAETVCEVSLLRDGACVVALRAPAITNFVFFAFFRGDVKTDEPQKNTRNTRNSFAVKKRKGKA
ncbi:MAG TPA: hypothetical protein VGM23_02290, partial [Armatimonadota bacterium]